MIRTLRRFVQLLICMLIVHWLFYDSGIEWNPMFAQLAWLVGMGMGYLLGKRIGRMESALSADGTPLPAPPPRMFTRF